MQQWRKRSGQLLVVILMVLILLSMGSLVGYAAIAEKVEIHFIDVGQGDSILIQTNTGKAVLIDGGDRSEGSTVVKYLKRAGVKQIDLMVSTHPHADHIGGLDDVLRAFKVNQVLDAGISYSSSTFEEYLELIMKKKIPFDTPETAREYKLDGILFKVLGPKRVHDETNDNSVVVKMIFDEFSALFTGDLEGEGERDLLLANLHSTLLKVGHHGSNTSTGDLFLFKVKPQLAVISVGKGNKYGHPATETLKKLNKLGVSIYRTDEQGTIVVSTTGKKYWVNQEAIHSTAIEKIDFHGYPGLYVGSIKSDKYHETNCRYAKKISSDHQIWFQTALEAIQAGYKPCGVCKPPQQ